jgi:multicomponent Na+:H+ antiporter subunit E
MIGYPTLILRLTLWFLLTSDVSSFNIVLGFIIALVLPQPYPQKRKGSLRAWCKAIWEVIKTLPVAYREAWEIMVSPHNGEEIIRESPRLGRSPGLIFLDIFLITFTPKSIVVKYDQSGEYDVHHIYRRRNNHE